MGAVYASITLAVVVVLLYVLFAFGGPVGRGLVVLLLTPVLLVVVGAAVGLVLGFSAGSSMPWVKRFRQQQTGAATADPYETALALAAKLPKTRWVPFMYALRKAWEIDEACADMATEFMARTPGRVQ